MVLPLAQNSCHSNNQVRFIRRYLWIFTDHSFPENLFTSEEVHDVILPDPGVKIQVNLQYPKKKKRNHQKGIEWLWPLQNKNERDQ